MTRTRSIPMGGGRTAGDVTVDDATSDGTATTDGADYTAVAATLLSHPNPSAATTLGPHTAAALRTVDNE